MTDETTEALKLAEALENDAKEHREVSYGLDCPPERTANWKHALNCEAAARLIRESLAEQELYEPEGRCKECLAYNGHLDYCSKAAPVSEKRKWVELTDYEIVMLYAESPMCDSEMIDFARAVIATFKEKNK